LCKEHQGIDFLVTIKDIQPFAELFAPYGIGDEMFPIWPLAFLGDPHQQIDEYKSYLNKPPTGVTPAQKKEAKQLLIWLKQDLAIDQVSRSLDIATPLLEVLSALLGMLDMQRLEDMLDAEVEEHDEAMQ